MKILDISIPSNQGLEHHCALNFHLFGQQGIVRFNRTGKDLRGAGGQMNPSGGISYSPGIGAACPEITGVLGCKSTLTEFVPA